MKGFARVALLGLAAAVWQSPPPLATAQDDQETQAVEAAKAWQALVDSGRYGESWDAAAAVFQAAVTRKDWVGSLDQVRKPLGEVRSREFASADLRTDPPNSPKGEYVIIRFETSFENLGSAIETVVMRLADDGTWKLSGYFITPQ